MPDCIFCKIASGDIPAKLAFSDENLVAFHDINPQAPTHIQIIPRRHIATLNDLNDADDLLAGKMILTARKIAVDLGIADDGYRLVFNCNRDGGQAVFHIHLHLLGGRRMHWPPG